MNIIVVERVYPSHVPHHLDGTEPLPSMPSNEGCNRHPPVAKSASLEI